MATLLEHIYVELPNVFFYGKQCLNSCQQIISYTESEDFVNKFSEHNNINFEHIRSSYQLLILCVLVATRFSVADNPSYSVNPYNLCYKCRAS